MLFDPDRHERLAQQGWDAETARAAITTIADDALARYSPRDLWPPHPLDGEGDGARAPFAMVDIGAAGVILALDWLARAGAPVAQFDFRAILDDLLARNEARIGRDAQSLLVGRSGILLVACRLAPSPQSADRLVASIAANAGHPSRELMWGIAGTMHAALEMHERTGERRWAEQFRHGADELARSFVPHPAAGCRLWTQDLNGARPEYLGATHGFAGNAGAIARGLPLLSDPGRTWWTDRIIETTLATAMRRGAHANWPPTIGDGKRLVQWCHGAPGFVTSLAGLGDSRLDDVLVAAGELVWAAGPLTKGAGLCHGTAGNGYAFLKLWRRTGDPRWLDRARAFAMHAIAQSERHLREYGMRRYSLWTGDLGLAVYLWNCVIGGDRWPILDPVDDR
jgi:hypothetical protein